METLPPFSLTAKKVKMGVYEHYKGKRYRLLNVGRHSETLEEFVVYQGLYGPGDVWVRPLSLFLESVNGAPRFRLVERAARESYPPICNKELVAPYRSGESSSFQEEVLP